LEIIISQQVQCKHINQIISNFLFDFFIILRYQGEVKNGLRDGFGTYTSTEGIIYEGNWSNGLKHGNGKMTIKENMMYDGDWREGIKHGAGRIKWPSGNIYDGDL
jgi:hypothetical protein